MRILVVDDEAAVRDAYRHALERAGGTGESKDLLDLASELFASASVTPKQEPDIYQKENIEYVSQGLDAVATVEQNIGNDTSFQVAFIDVRMPPGIDGKETARRIREIDPDINIVIVTAYSDHRISDIMSVAGPANKIMYLKKPFAADEVRQMARSLSAQWDTEARTKRELHDIICRTAASDARVETATQRDPLTGAWSRLSFSRELELRAQEDASKLSLILLDVDHFKAINEIHGHSSADEVLCEMHAVLSKACPDSAFIGRLGADAFGILVEAEAREAVKICVAAHAACQPAFTILDRQIILTVSAGVIAATEIEGSDGTDLLQFANIALDNAKRDGPGGLCFFDAEMQAEALFYKVIKADLAKALEAGELAVHYQSIVSSQTFKIVGFEALVRWNSPQHGSVSPAVFIPIAEEGPLIYDLGEWVLRRALEDCKNWPDQYVSVNVSPRQFKGIDLQELVVRCADEAGVPFARVQIEVTETALFDDPFHSYEVLKSLQLLGFRIALDDFGTGYSNMSRVKAFALNGIKIDKSFVDDLGQHQNALTIVSSMVHLAHSLGISVVAEGVETATQLDILRTIGCSYIQGHLFGAAEPIEIANERIARDALDENLYPHLTSQKAG